MPAGMVLVVAVMALVVAMFLSADSIKTKADGRRNNSDFRKTTAEAIASVSDAVKLDVPAKAVDDAVAPYIGHEKKTENVSSDDVLAQRRAREAAALAATTPTTAATTPSGGDGPPPTDPTAPSTTPPTTAPARPVLRKPTPDAPLKLWVGGDSISYEPGVAISNIAAQTKLFNVITDSRPSTGLTRPDFFNWPQHLDRDVVPLDGGGIDPDVIMIMFGGNDAQNIPMPAPIGGYVLGSADWQTEYRKRVADTMDLLKSPKNDRLVVWLGAPIMGPHTVAHLDQLDYIYYTEAIKRPWVLYVDSWPYFADPSGAYAKSLPAADGKAHIMRANDNIHFSALGGDRLATVAYTKLGTLVDLAAAPFVPDPDKTPPADVAERAEVPPGDGSTPAP